MKRLLPVIVLVLISILSFAQKVKVTIQQHDKRYSDKDFTIIKVVDNRTDKDYIGTIYKSDATSEFYAVTDEPLPVEVMKFYNRTYSNRISDNKIVITINKIDIGHILVKHNKDSGFVFIDFNFYKSINDTLYFLSNYTKRLCEEGNEIPQSHSNRIKRALLLAANGLEKSLKDTALVKSVRKNTGFIFNDGGSQSDVYTLKELEKTDSIAKRYNISKQMFFIGGHAVIGTSYNLFGGNICYMKALRKHPRQFLGVHLNYSTVATFKNAVNLPAGVVSYEVKASDFGLRYLGQIKSIVFFNSAMHLFIGNESYNRQTVNYNTVIPTVERRTESSLFLGSQLDFGLWLLPPVKKGPYISVDVIFRVTNSIIFSDDAGVRLGAGFKF